MMIHEKIIENFKKYDLQKRTKVAFSESDISKWFEENFISLGFQKILKRQWNITPDFIMLNNDGKEIKVEIELFASDFIKHKHKVSEADVVICCIKDVELDKNIKIITLNHIFISFWSEIWREGNIPFSEISKSCNDFWKMMKP